MKPPDSEGDADRKAAAEEAGQGGTASLVSFRMGKNDSVEPAKERECISDILDRGSEAA